MKKGFIGGIIIMTFLLFLTSCGCNDEEFYKQKFKFNPGDFVTHKVSGSKILIIDTLRINGDCECKVELDYYGVNSEELNDRYGEIELK